MRTENRFSSTHLFSYAVSASLHMVLLVALGSLVAKNPIERAEIAGTRVVITSAFAASAVPDAAVPAVTEVEPEQQPLAEAEAVKQETAQPAEEPAEPSRPELEPQPLNLEKLLVAVSLPHVSVRQSRQQISRPASLDVSPARRRQQQQQVRPPQFRSEVETGTPPHVEMLPKPQPVQIDESIRRRPAPPALLPQPEADHPADNPVASSQSAPQVLGTSPIKPARAVSNPSPVYPPDAVSEGSSGVVVLSVIVAQSGQVTTVEVAESSGDQRLDQAAMTAVRQWQFTPATQSGRPVEWTARLPVRFRID